MLRVQRTRKRRRGEPGQSTESVDFEAEQPEFDFNRTGADAIGRIYPTSPREGELFYLRSLLVNVPGALSFRDVRTMDERYLVFSVKHAVCLECLPKTWRLVHFEAFKSSFATLSPVFAPATALCSPSNQ